MMPIAVPLPPKAHLVPVQNLHRPAREDKVPGSDRAPAGRSLEQRQHLRDQPLIKIPYPRPVNLDGPQAQCKTPLLAVTVAIAGLFQSVTLALAFSRPNHSVTSCSNKSCKCWRIFTRANSSSSSYNILFDSSFPLCSSLIGVSFLCLLQQAAFRFEIHERVRPDLFPISTLFDYSSIRSESHR